MYVSAHKLINKKWRESTVDTLMMYVFIKTCIVYDKYKVTKYTTGMLKIWICGVGRSTVHTKTHDE